MVNVVTGGKAMKKSLLVLASALIALPIFAAKPTPIPVVTGQGSNARGFTVQAVQKGGAVTPTPPAANRSINLNSSKSNRIIQPTVTPTLKPEEAKATTVHSSKSNSSDRVVQSTVAPTPEPVEKVKIEALTIKQARERATVTPTPDDPVGEASARSRKINTSKSNLRVQPTVTPTAVEGKPSKEQREDHSGHLIIQNIKARELATVTPTPAATSRPAIHRTTCLENRGSDHRPYRARVLVPHLLPSESANVSATA